MSSCESRLSSKAWAPSPVKGRAHLAATDHIAEVSWAFAAPTDVLLPGSGCYCIDSGCLALSCCVIWFTTLKANPASTVVNLHVFCFFSVCLLIPAQSQCESFSEVCLFISHVDCLFKAVRVSPHDLHFQQITIKPVHQESYQLFLYCTTQALGKGVMRQGE